MGRNKSLTMDNERMEEMLVRVVQESAAAGSLPTKSNL